MGVMTLLNRPILPRKKLLSIWSKWVSQFLDICYQNTILNVYHLTLLYWNLLEGKPNVAIQTNLKVMKHNDHSFINLHESVLVMSVLNWLCGKVNLLVNTFEPFSRNTHGLYSF